MGSLVFEFSIEYGSFTLTVTGHHGAESFVGHLSMTFEGIRMLTANSGAATFFGERPSVSDIVTVINDSFPNAPRLGLDVFGAATLLAARWPVEVHNARAKPSRH